MVECKPLDEGKAIRVNVTQAGSSSRFHVEPGFKNVKAIGDKVRRCRSNR